MAAFLRFNSTGCTHWPAGAEVAIPALRAGSGTTVSLLGEPGTLRWSQHEGQLVITTGQLRGEYAWGLKITPAPHLA